jgi:methyl-accepting chemotaxis protein
VTKIRRKNYLPLPSLQLQLVVICLFFAACTGMMQGILLQRFVTELLLELPEASAIPRHEAATWVLRQFFVSLAVLFPFVLGLGVILTFRYAGPIVNIERHLRRVAAGEDPGPCRLRKNDQFQHLAEAVNLAIAAARSGASQALPATDTIAKIPQAIEQTAT